MDGEKRLSWGQNESGRKTVARESLLEVMMDWERETGLGKVIYTYQR